MQQQSQPSSLDDRPRRQAAGATSAGRLSNTTTTTNTTSPTNTTSTTTSRTVAWPATRRALIGQTLEEVEAFVVQHGGNAQHARRVYSNVFVHRRRFADIREVPQRVLHALGDQFHTRPLAPQAVRIAADGTRKYRFVDELGSGFEAVYIPGVTQRGDTNTLCVSSQTGCALRCSFCYTGSLTRHDDLSAAQIVGQVMAAQQDVAQLGPQAGITNIVFMGMGEPLLNYDQVVRAARVLLQQEGLDFSRRRITISTAGVVPRIYELGRDLGTLLAVSLNATTDTVRNSIMPINRRWPLATLIEAMRDYPRPRNGRITVEYVLLGGINDSLADARRLAELLQDIPVKINLLPLNEHERTAHVPPAPQAVRDFQAVLWQAGYSAIVRSQRGQEVAAACGQLGAGMQTRADAVAHQNV